MYLPFQKQRKTLYGEGIQTGTIDIFFFIWIDHTFLLNQFIFCKEEVVAIHF